MVDLNLGKILNKKYQLLSQLGEGAMGIVYRAAQLDIKGRPQREVALKMIKGDFAEDLMSRQRFSREVEIAMNLRSPHVVVMHDSGEDEEGHLYYVMELVRGQTLKSLLQTQGPLTAERTIYIAEQICEVLAEAHDLPESVVHRDLKPANIFVEQRLDWDWIKIADFGIAKVLGAKAVQLTTTSGIIGSPPYMAPEQWRENDVDFRTDLYALGVLLYEMLCGRPPFCASTRFALMQQHLSKPPPRLPSTLPSPLCSLIMQLLAKNPDARPRSARTVRQQLANIQEYQKDNPSERRKIDQEETQSTPRVQSSVLFSEDCEENNDVSSDYTPSTKDVLPPTESEVEKVWRNKSKVLTGMILLVGAAGVLGWRSFWAPSPPSLEKPPAVRALLENAERGDVVAQFNLGVVFAVGSGVPQDFQEAERWYTKAAEQNYPNAQTNLCALYAQGKGNPLKFHEAARWCKKAAEQGNAVAQANLGTLYAQGQGVSQDPAEAERWWRQAAEQGNAEAQYNLGVLYEQGRRGESPNYAEAGKWYSKAAEQGFRAAERNLGRFYANGLGVTKDLTVASRWYRNAAAKGDAYAQEQLKKLHGTNDVTP